nr:hypothetical protein [Halomonas sp. 1513]
MPDIPLSKIKSPSGALGEIERTSIALANQSALSSWLDPELVSVLLCSHPVSVKKVSRHYEVVSGFRAFHAARELLDSDESIVVGVMESEEPDLVKWALFELITHSLLHLPASPEAREIVYRQLKKLVSALRNKHGVKVTKDLSAKSLKTMMGLEEVRITRARKRKSELQRMLERS